jgi:D-sedoheptulose 7-phosphate isomerase
MDSRKLLQERIKDHIQVTDNLLSTCGEDMIKLFDVCVNAIRRGNKIILFGNGGSASQAEHIAGELVGKFYKVRKALPAISLTTSSTIVTATANDISFDEVFLRQIEALGNKGDVAIGLSTSGNSKNVINAIKKANEIGLYTVAFTGETGGKLKDLSNLCIRIPSQDTPRIQEMHILLGHILCEVIEEALS